MKKDKTNIMKTLTKLRKIPISKKIKILPFLSIAILSMGWFIYHSYEEKQLVLYKGYVEEAKIALDKEDYDKAIGSLTDAIRVFPKDAMAYYLRAYPYFIKGEYDKAISDTDMVLKISNDNPAMFYNLRGDSYRYSQHFPEATEAYAKAYSISPKDRDTVDNYSGGLIATEQSEKAYQVIRKYFDETPKDDYWEDADMWYDRALASLGVHRCMEASTSAWHLLMRTTDEKQKAVGEGVMHNALNDKECIDQGTFQKGIEQ